MQPSSGAEDGRGEAPDYYVNDADPLSSLPIPELANPPVAYLAPTQPSPSITATTTSPQQDPGTGLKPGDAPSAPFLPPSSSSGIAQPKVNCGDDVPIAFDLNEVDGPPPGSPFAISKEQLRHLVDSLKISEDSSDAPLALRKLSGIEAFATKYLRSDVRHGLCESETEKEDRARYLGANLLHLPSPPRRPFFRVFLATLADPMLLILLVLAVVMIVFRVVGGAVVQLAEDPEDSVVYFGDTSWYLDWAYGFCIFLAVGVICLVASIFDYQRDLRMQTLSSFDSLHSASCTCHVIRNRQMVIIPSSELLVGDVLIVPSPGDQIPPFVDGILVPSSSSSSVVVGVDESVLTGSTETVMHSATDRPLLMAPMSVVSVDEAQSQSLSQAQEARMVVVAVGENSEWGVRMSGAKDAEENEETPFLEKTLAQIAMLTGCVAFAVAGFCFLALLIGFLVERGVGGTFATTFARSELCGNGTEYMTEEMLQSAKGCSTIKDHVSDIVEFVIFAVTLICATVAEGLPLSLKSGLSFSSGAMLEGKIYLRKMFAIDALTRCTVICVGSSGTLTRNDKTVSHVWCDGRGVIGDRGRDAPLLTRDEVPLLLELISDNIAVNTTANLIDVNEQAGDRHEIERALLSGIENWFGVDYRQIRLSHPVRKRFAFSSEEKCMSTVVEKEGLGTRLYCKGAAEIVLAKCDTYVNKEGEVVLLDKLVIGDFSEEIERMATELADQHIVALAYRDFTLEEVAAADESGWKREDLESHLVLFMMVGFADPVRENCSKSVRRCSEAGISLRLISGDHISSARRLALQCGILTENGAGTCFDGSQFSEMSEGEQQEIVPTVSVLARCDPKIEKQLVGALKTSGEFVALTGHGSQDGVCLRSADVGIALGESGTTVAKDASDLVVLDDSLKSIVRAVRWSRAIFDNTRKLTQFEIVTMLVLWIVCLVAAITRFVPFTVGGTTFALEFPFTAIQLLWVCLVMDTFGSVVLMHEKPHKDIMIRSPEDYTGKFITTDMWISILSQTAYQVVVLLLLHVVGPFIREFQVITYGYCRNGYWDGARFVLFSSDSECLANGMDFECYKSRPFVKNTMLFTTFVLMQVVHLVCSRRIWMEWNVFDLCPVKKRMNFYLLAVVIIIVLVQIGLTTLGTLGVVHSVLSTCSLEWFQWLFCIGFALLGFGVHFAKTAIVRLVRSLLLGNQRSSQRSGLVPLE